MTTQLLSQDPRLIGPDVISVERHFNRLLKATAHHSSHATPDGIGNLLARYAFVVSQILARSMLTDNKTLGKRLANTVGRCHIHAFRICRSKAKHRQDRLSKQISLRSHKGDRLSVRGIVRRIRHGACQFVESMPDPQKFSARDKFGQHITGNTESSRLARVA